MDGLEQPLWTQLVSLSAVLIPLQPYADDLIIMSTIAAGLQRQLDAMQQFCHQRQLRVNPAKTNVVLFGSKPACQAFVSLAMKWTEWSQTQGWTALKVPRGTAPSREAAFGRLRLRGSPPEPFRCV